MLFNLTISELGQGLKKIEKEYGLVLMVKMNLSGGWMTMNGEVSIEKIPAILLGGNSKSNNVIEIKVNSKDYNGTVIKLIGAKDKMFNVAIEPSKYKVLGLGSYENKEIKTKDKECKVTIDNDIIFTVKEAAEEVINLIK